ncbi:MAG: quinolinate synthase NadA [Gallicola sp.]|nr:quinolinate synthase NadA [Gallicola sp.]
MKDIDRINQLKKEKNAVIMAHYYVDGEIQKIADEVGDSYYLSKKASETDADKIILCGVSFMGESAKILNSDKEVYLPDRTADCPMAHMIEEDLIEEMRQNYEDLAVVCYINSTAETKTYSDVCVTSSNAVKIVKELPNHNIFFIPDGNLGRYVADQVPDKNIILNKGYCPIHQKITVEKVKDAKTAHPEAVFAAHPECTYDVLKEADYVGSTSGIIEYVTASDKKEFIIGTEIGIFYQLKEKNPDKIFYPVMENQICEDMKKLSLEQILEILEGGGEEVQVAEGVREKSLIPLERMLHLGS